MKRKPTLRELAKSRGYADVVTLCIGTRSWEAGADNGIDNFHAHPIQIEAPTRRATEAGLRAVLEAMPARKGGEK